MYFCIDSIAVNLVSFRGAQLECASQIYARKYNNHQFQDVEYLIISINTCWLSRVVEMIILYFFLCYTHSICIQNRILAMPILIHQLTCFKYIQDIISFPRESSTRWNVRFGNKLRKTKLLKLLRYILLILSFNKKRKGARYDLHDCKNITFISFFIYVDLFLFLFIRVL